ncbi:hypothetical protein MATL_G00136650 [Megalops atlanticus]|uniref:Uncharacterized protein n=1 Tax=Megalops atlanticus TaxID=7932 RepID=A0A9D3T4E1_MEGAT|nr:hypothetical protein MATL_G00136650 [Megalops atlanticus]
MCVFGSALAPCALSLPWLSLVKANLGLGLPFLLIVHFMNLRRIKEIFLLIALWILEFPSRYNWELMGGVVGVSCVGNRVSPQQL